MTTVRFSVEDDGDAAKLSAVLEALGYEAKRDVRVEQALGWAASRLSAKYKFNESETMTLDRVLEGNDYDAIGLDLGITKGTVKWHMHNISFKTGTTSRESLMRLALTLVVVVDPSGNEPEQSGLGEP